ncbi:MAG: cation:proton antiporter [Weeksellaceae bacterium]
MHLHPEALFLLQSIILIGLPYALWRIKIIRNLIPVAIVQILVGVLLGPSVLGVLQPHVFEFLFAKESLSVINGLSWMAIVLFGFLTGLHFDIEEIKSKGVSFGIVGLASIVIPFMLAIGSAWWLYNTFPQLAGPNATQFTFIFGMCIAASVTALPVLGAILVEMGLITTKVGKSVLGFSTIVDCVLWIVISILLAISSGGGLVGVVKTIGLTLVYLAVMIIAVKPFLDGLVKRKIWTVDPNNVQLVAVSVLLILSALATELIGIHYLLGAFIFGALIPKEIAQALYHKKEPLVLVILLPYFFISAGLKTTFDLSSAEVWVVFGLMALTSAVGKIFGTAITARFIGKYSKRESMTFGVFMMCKGMMDLVILNVILGAGIISSVTYSGMVLTAIVLATATKPLALLVRAKLKDGNMNEESVPAKAMAH